MSRKDLAIYTPKWVDRYFGSGLRGIEDMFGDMDRFFEDFDLPGFRHRWGRRHQYGLEEVKETKDNYIVKVPLPGLEKDKINMTLEDNVLTIEANNKYDTEDKKEEEGVVYHTRKMGSFSYNRSWQVPDGTTVEQIQPTYKNGILEVTIPKPEQKKTEAKKIELK